MKNKKQIIFIHGGECFATNADYILSLKQYKLEKRKLFKSNKWTESLDRKLPKFEVLSPEMPNRWNSKYPEWEIYFKKIFPFLKTKVILVGHSLGAIFLLKYLSENNFPKKISQLHLVAPAVLDDGLGLEKLSGFKPNIKKINKIEKKCDEIHLYHSKDDSVCIFKNSEIIKKNIPSSNFHVFTNRGHFSQTSFPEILKVIKKVK
ncbi:MAG: alpha/beta hydrolase [Minisyncoccia bacterium]